MPSNTIEVKVDNSQAKQSFEELIKSAKDLYDEVSKVFGALSRGGVVSPQAMGKLQELSGAQSSASVAKASMAPKGGGDVGYALAGSQTTMGRPDAYSNWEMYRYPWQPSSNLPAMTTGEFQAPKGWQTF